MAKSVNIIFAAATLPALAAALEAISNGNETYVYLARGKTYCGIDKIKQFHNMGYDEEKSQPIDDEKAFTAAVRTVKELLEKDNSLFFNFYAREFDAFRCAGIASAAGLSKTNFHIYLMEDGFSTYKNLNTFWGKDSTKQLYRDFFYKISHREWLSEKLAEIVSKFLSMVFANIKLYKSTCDNMVYKHFKGLLSNIEKRFNDIINSESIVYSSKLLSRNIQAPFLLSFHPNFTQIIQSRDKQYAVIDSRNNVYLSKLIRGKDTIQPKIIYKSISERVKLLNDKQKETYMQLVLPDYVAQLFFRKDRCGISAPDKKLVCICPRFDTMFIRPVTDIKYGIGPLQAADFPDSYNTLESKYKTCFLFSCEKDFTAVYEIVNSFFQNIDMPEEVIYEAKRKVFNLYMNYIFVLKFIFFMYGKKYDIIVKNHPATDFGYSGGEDIHRTQHMINISKCLDIVMKEFFLSDSVGKYFAIAPGGLSTENFEFIGADISFGGQPSSVYSGLSKDAKILFIICDSNIDVGNYFNGNPHFSKDSETPAESKTTFYDTDKFVNSCAEIAQNQKNPQLCDF